MQLSDWRTSKGLSFAETARALGIDGVNPGGTLARIERGARRPDADMVERIVNFTGGAVSAGDMHAVRLAWLKANQPDRLTLVDEVHAFQDCMEAAE
mgnify:CR=1 FL=1